MCKIRSLAYCVLFTIFPSLLVYPYNHMPYITLKVASYTPEQHMYQKEPHQLSYDEIMNLLDDLESGRLENKCSPAALEQVNQFFAFLAKQGVLPDAPDEELNLDQDIEELLNSQKNSFRYLDTNGQYIIIPAVFYSSNSNSIVFCKSWIKQQYEKTKHFVKKHKKEIIIGAVIVVAVAVVVVAAIVASSAETSDSSNPLDSEEDIQDKTSGTLPSVHSAPKELPSPVIATDEAPKLKATLDDQIALFKKFLVEDKIAEQTYFTKEYDECSFGEKAREFGAHLAHQAFDEISNMARVIPELCEEINDIGSYFFERV